MGRNRFCFNDHAVNKADEYSIVYQNGNRRISIKSDDIPVAEMTECKLTFEELKKDLDKTFKDICNGDHTEARRCFLIDDYSAYEDKAYIGHTEKLRSAKLNQQLNEAMELLTETQKRRFDMYFLSGMTLRKIAEQEKVDFKAVHRSVKAAQKKIQDYFIGLGESSAFHR